MIVFLVDFRVGAIPRTLWTRNNLRFGQDLTKQNFNQTKATQGEMTIRDVILRASGSLITTKSNNKQKQSKLSFKDSENLGIGHRRRNELSFLDPHF